MKFRVKMTLCMVCLMALLFSVGGAVLISMSFRDALGRETLAARNAYQMLLNSIQVFDDFDGQLGSSDISEILKQLSKQEATAWSSLRVSEGEEVIYQSGGQAALFRNISEGLDESHCLVGSLQDASGGHFLQVSGVFSLSNNRLRLDMAYNSSTAYTVRAQQQRIYQGIFFIMLTVCALLSYSISWLLTRPLVRLTGAVQKIAEGDLSCRSQINTNDEIGVLSGQFDEMVVRIERNVLELEEAMQRQKRFMGSFAHELKTPMTSIIGCADLLRSRALEEEERAAAENYIFSEGRRLERLSLKLLDILVAENREITLVAASPARLIDELTQQLSPIYHANGIAVSSECEKGECLMDPDLVRSLMINLLDNAKKAIEGGGKIEIASKMLPDGCEITVADSGRGIPAEALAHLTEAFYRVEKSRARALGGVGLGLPLCSEIVNLHHGTLTFESEPGQGTHVVVTLRSGRT